MEKADKIVIRRLASTLGISYDRAYRLYSGKAVLTQKHLAKLLPPYRGLLDMLVTKYGLIGSVSPNAIADEIKNLLGDKTLDVLELADVLLHLSGIIYKQSGQVDQTRPGRE